MDLKLSNRLALVSGSTAGIGFAIAASLAAEGARVIVNGRTQAARRRGGRRAAKHPAAKSRSSPAISTAAAAAELARRLPGVEILVNNLGIFEPKPFEEIPDDDWRRFFEVNVLSGVRLAGLPAGHAKAQLGPDHLHLQRDRGADSRRDDPLRHDQDRAARRLARPGRVDRRHRHHGQLRPARPDPLRGVEDFVEAARQAEGKPFDEFEKEFFEKVRPTSLIKRFATTEEVAALVAYVASPLASATTGAALRVDGGVVKTRSDRYVTLDVLNGQRSDE